MSKPLSDPSMQYTFLGRHRQLVGELISEAIAMLIIIVIGLSVVCMFTLYDPSPYETAYWGLCITWGMAVTLAIYVTGSISGTHANPAVTLALVLFRGFPVRKMLPYWAAQVTGAFLGAVLVYILFQPMIDHYNTLRGLARESGGAVGVFVTMPGHAIPPMRALVNEIIQTAILLFGIFAITEQYNEMAPKANLGAVMIGLLITTIGASMGYLSGWALNPARDLGPRMFAYLAGWNESAFPAPDQYWWVPLVGPMVGGVLGAFAYQTLIHPFLPARSRLAPPIL
jgi:glycerol uptake facilitator protein